MQKGNIVKHSYLSRKIKVLTKDEKHSWMNNLDYIKKEKKLECLDAEIDAIIWDIVFEEDEDEEEAEVEDEVCSCLFILHVSSHILFIFIFFLVDHSKRSFSLSQEYSRKSAQGHRGCRA